MSFRDLKALEDYLKDEIIRNSREEAEFRTKCNELQRQLHKLMDQACDELPPLAADTTKCPLCPATYARTESVRRHLQKVHDKQVPPRNKGRPSKGGKSASNNRQYEMSKVDKGMIEKAETAKRLKEARLDRLRKAAEEALAKK